MSAERHAATSIWRQYVIGIVIAINSLALHCKLTSVPPGLVAMNKSGLPRDSAKYFLRGSMAKWCHIKVNVTPLTCARSTQPPNATLQSCGLRGPLFVYLVEFHNRLAPDSRITK